MPQQQDDLNRLRQEYANRHIRLAGKETYSFFNAVYLFAIQQRQRAVLKSLRWLGLSTLHGLRILEMGCGSGGVLSELVTLGAQPDLLAGVDLLPVRLREAHCRLPSSVFSEADGQNLPHPAACFDLAFQFTAFSSILDNQIRQNAAEEMLRVLKPGGAILWYDFWWNPTNPQTRGITLREIRSLFPSCICHFQRITLAPPIARRIVPLSWAAAILLENLRLFNSHYLAVLVKP